MSFEQSEAIVLRKVDFSETSRIVTFLTPQRGRFACMVKGARRKGSPMVALLDTYNRLEITYTWKESRQVQLLTEASLLDGFDAIKASIEHIACAAFLLEIAGLIAQENNPAPDLFDASVEGLQALAKTTQSPFISLIPAAYTLFEVAGIAPDPDEESCFEYILPSFAPDERQDVRQMLLDIIAGRQITAPEQFRLLLRFLNEYGVYHLERRLKSYSFLASLAASTQ